MKKSAGIDTTFPKEEVSMKDVQSTRHATWVRLWRTLLTWDEAINLDPVESLERRVAALEQRIWYLNERSGARTE
jgi:hypothetical protein